jgi:hypothetical protein
VRPVLPDYEHRVSPLTRSWDQPDRDFAREGKLVQVKVVECHIVMSRLDEIGKTMRHDWLCCRPTLAGRDSESEEWQWDVD